MRIFKYIAEFAASLLFYMLVLIFSLTYLKKTDLSFQVKLVITLLPLLPCVLIVWSILRHVAKLDELQRHIQLNALALAFVGTALITFSYGFLENIGFPNLSMFTVWPLMAILWGIGVAVGSWQYR